MTGKNLKSKAISIKGKSYVLVSDRVVYFNEAYPKGTIKTQLKSEPDAEMIVMKAQVTPDIENAERYFTGYSQAKWGEGMVNKTAALENAETSAVGRALAMMGIGVIESLASADEVKKATVNTPADAEKIFGSDILASDAQKKLLFVLGKKIGLDSDKLKTTIKTKYKLESYIDLSKKQASEAIDKIQALVDKHKENESQEVISEDDLEAVDDGY